ncbi:MULTISPECIES: hypothetical protein [unclassified Undibacterium]|uniref:hypothetical protein n=1 Tax=unclassified Undibacterium TaxID=2630295 RepID=UPI002AC8EEBC|nr:MULTISPECIES: hypothetical protein [unclassified Undibacterium]MEB0140611.1 hypothetical protein [Undibacterium sp. CCC2.1]MEB0173483.1 hypothetical protein [Undibacterium sp. CCC1.1]MEB0177615.1 hypothetical protein [Undibacterium sp. CCC3.4]MEB0216789.1 hypothetical protein [Undibacterium sp. 5I2]WPX44661.1 hypothetical protein RHM61_05385 [Undibacterium sp. CCC3.4]
MMPSPPTRSAHNTLVNTAILAAAVLLHLGLWLLLRDSGQRISQVADSAYLTILSVAIETRQQSIAPAPKSPARDRPGNRPPPRQSASAPAAAMTLIEPATTTATTEPASLDLNALKRSALAYDKQNRLSPAALAAAANAQHTTLEQRLQDGTRKAERKDCLHAYSGLGILAIIPLAAASVIDTGCNW